MLNLPGITYDRTAVPMWNATEALKQVHAERRARLLRLGGGPQQEWTKGIAFGPPITDTQRQRARDLCTVRKGRELGMFEPAPLQKSADAIALYRLHYHSELVERAKPFQGLAIMSAVARHYNFTVADLKSASRYAELAAVRMESMWLCAKLTLLSLPQIGRVHGGRDHTTVIHAIRRMNARFNDNVRGLGTKVKRKRADG